MAKRICTIYVIEEERQVFGETHKDTETFDSLEWAKLEMEERFKGWKKVGKREVEWRGSGKLIANISDDRDYFYINDGGQQIIAYVKPKRVKRFFGF